MKKNKEIKLSGKQIRVWVDGKTYQKLKEETKDYGLQLNHYCGLILKGLKVQRTENSLTLTQGEDFSDEK